MTRAYSLDLRERVGAAVGAGQLCRSVAKIFMVSVASVVRWSQRQRRNGSPAPYPGWQKTGLRGGGRTRVAAQADRRKTGPDAAGGYWRS